MRCVRFLRTRGHDVPNIIFAATVCKNENMTKIAIKILQGSAITQKTLSGLITYLPFCKFPVVHVCQKF